MRQCDSLFSCTLQPLIEFGKKGVLEHVQRLETKGAKLFRTFGALTPPVSGQTLDTAIDLIPSFLSQSAINSHRHEERLLAAHDESSKSVLLHWARGKGVACEPETQAMKTLHKLGQCFLECTQRVGTKMSSLGKPRESLCVVVFLEMKDGSFDNIIVRPIKVWQRAEEVKILQECNEDLHDVRKRAA